MTHRPPDHRASRGSRRSLDERLRVLPRAAMGIIALLLTVAVGGQLLATRRLGELQRDQVPALAEIRALSGALRLFHAGLGAPATDVSRAEQAEAAAALGRRAEVEGRSPALRAMASRATAYFAATREAEHFGTDPRAPAMERRYEALDSDLATLTAVAESDATNTLGAARSLQLSAMLALLVGGGATLLLVSLIGLSSRRSVDRWVEQVTETVCALADGALDTPIPRTEDGATGRLHDGLRRLACELQEHARQVFPAPGRPERLAPRDDAAPARPPAPRQLADAPPKCDEGRVPVLLKEDSFDLSYAAVTPRGRSTQHIHAGARSQPAAQHDDSRPDNSLPAPASSPHLHAQHP